MKLRRMTIARLGPHFNEVIYWIGMISLAGICLYLKTRSTVAPVVLPDEYAYFNYIKLLAGEHQLNTSQYGPLYIILASFFCDTSDVVHSYERIRLLNLVVFSLSFIPLKLLAGRFFESKWLSTPFALGFVFLPWSTLVTPIWAEPLFYMLYCWSWYFCFKAFISEKIQFYFLAGTSISLMLLAKQGGGLVLGVAYAVICGLEIFRSSEKRAAILKFFSGILPIVLTFAGYFLITRYISVGGIGYSNVSSAISKVFLQIFFSHDFFQTFMIQISYLIVSGFFIFPASLVIASFDYRKLDLGYRKFYLLVVLAIFGLCLLIAFFMNTTQISFNDPNESRLAYGRYLSPLIPPIVLIGAAALPNTWHRRLLQRNLYVWLALVICLIVYTPLFSNFVYGVINAPDTMYISRFFGHDFPPWDRTIADSLAKRYRVWFAVATGTIGIIWALAHSKKPHITPFLFCIVAIIVGQANAMHILKISQSVRNESETYRFLAQERIHPNELLRFGSYLPHLYMAEFWLGEFDKNWQNQSLITSDGLKEYINKRDRSKYRYILSNEPLPPEFENINALGSEKKLPLYRLLELKNS